MPGTAMTDLQLRLSIDELNLILEGVGNLPFARVYALVGKIQSQAAEQLQAAQASSAGLVAPIGTAQLAPNVTPMAVAKG
jgi:hypothetical protein